jgi:hypothetical protein
MHIRSSTWSGCDLNLKLSDVLGNLGLGFLVLPGYISSSKKIISDLITHIFCADCLVTSNVKKKTLTIVGPPLRVNKHRSRHIMISIRINVCPNFLRRSK